MRSRAYPHRRRTAETRRQKRHPTERALYRLVQTARDRRAARLLTEADALALPPHQRWNLFTKVWFETTGTTEENR